MLASYHTHTYRCKHASGSEEEYIQKAIAEGVKILGFSDHAPMPDDIGELNYYRMSASEIGEYFSVLTSLKEKYRDKIEIKIGFETEYFPAIWHRCLDFWGKYPVDYLLLGQHFTSELDTRRDYIGSPSADEGRLKNYTDTAIMGMRSGHVTYFAHPDLINYTGDNTEFLRGENERLIREAVRLDIPLEFNLLGMADKRNYPRLDFWRMAAELGARVTVGCDSHSPSRVVNREEIEAAKKILSSLGIVPIDEVELKRVF